MVDESASLVQRRRFPRLWSVLAVQRTALWLFVFCGAIAIVEPSPYELMFVVALAIFASTGLRLNRTLVPLIVLLLLFNLGGMLSLVPHLDDQRSVTFIAISVYLMLSAIFFAAVVIDDTQARMEAVRAALLASAWVAGGAALIGYLDLGGLGSLFSRYERASGTFKDPNVLGPYLVLPIIFAVQDLLLGRARALRTLALVSVPLLALFLSFSRGAWLNLIGAGILLCALTFVTSRTSATRSRVALYAVAAVAVVAIAVAVALSFDQVSALFEQRASLDQDYDSGPDGRFGRQLRSIPLLLEHPNGLGPLRFGKFYFREDPHNVYINAFASYGWLGGLSYLALIATTWVVAWRAVFTRSPQQPHAIALWSVLCITTLQGLQIDTDHWRHFYLMLGLIWGLAAAAPQGGTGAPDAPRLR